MYVNKWNPTLLPLFLGFDCLFTKSSSVFNKSKLFIELLLLLGWWLYKNKKQDVKVN